MPAVKFEVDQARSSAFLKLMVAASVCSFVSNVSFDCFYGNHGSGGVEQHGTIYLLAGWPLLANQQ